MKDATELKELFGICSIPKDFKKFVTFWNDSIVELRYEISKENFYILSDEDYEIIDVGSKQYLSKSIWNYKSNKIFKSQTMYNDYLEQGRRAKIAEEERKKKEEIERIELEKVEQSLDEIGCIKYDEIGKGLLNYYTKQPGVRYYWNLIGNNYQILNDGDVLLEIETYNFINSSEFYGLRGTTFLGRSFKHKYRRGSHHIIGTYVKEKDDDNSGNGVYAILQNNEIIYIGMTMRSFKTRWKEHTLILDGLMQNNGGYMKLYNVGLTSKDIEFVELFNINTANFEGVITTRDVEAIELAFINLYKPKYNYMGVQKPYQFK